MPSLLIRNLDDEVKRGLRDRALRHGRSMEAEARTILHDALLAGQPPAPPRTGAEMVAAIRAIVEPIGGIDLPPIERGPTREPPDLD